MMKSNFFNDSSLFQFELDFNQTSCHEWMSRHWTSSFYWSIIYVILIFSGKYWMRNRDPFKLRTALFFWNLFLSVFSIMCTIRVLPEFIDILMNEGLEQSICDNRYMTDKRSALWLWLYTLSKLIELIDTLFIVVRKQNLIFLHWFHHLTVLQFSWASYHQMASVGRWFYNINLVIHSAMYGYYALKAIRIRVPKLVAQAITSVQILQMYLGLFTISYALYVKMQGRSCQSSYSILIWSLSIYISYLILFTNFFIKSYLNSSKQLKKQS